MNQAIYPLTSPDTDCAAKKRKYQEVWEILKRDKVCTLAAPKAFHARIKKAVIKEKDNDRGYKLLLAHQALPQTARLIVETTGAKITFKLSLSLGLGDI